MFWISQTNNHISCFEWCSVKILDDGQNCACLSELLAHLIQLSVYCSATASPLDCSNNLFYLMGFVTGLISWYRCLTFPKIFFTNKEDEDFMSPKVQKRKKSTLVSQTRTHFKLVHLRVLAGFVGLRRSQVHKDPCRTLQSPQIVDSIPDLLKGNSTYLLTTFLFFRGRESQFPRVNDFFAVVKIILLFEQLWIKLHLDTLFLTTTKAKRSKNHED